MKKQKVYIGNTSKNGISYYQFESGKLNFKYNTNDFERCTYLADNKNYIYSVIELKQGQILAYKKENNKLKYIDQMQSFGEGPCHIEINQEKKLIFVSNYNNGYLTIFKMKDDGGIGEKIYSQVNDEQKSHMHCVKMSQDNKYFFAVDLGMDIITAYEIQKDKIIIVDKINFKKDTQPRHIVINRDTIYVITEKTCELYTIKFSKRKLNIINVISLLPKDVAMNANYTGCAIKATKNFENIYVTIRGHNSISIYKVNEIELKLIQNIPCEGDLPRDLEIDKEEKYLLVANQDSNEIAVFKRSKINGKLTFDHKESIEAPTCVIIEEEL